MIVPATEKDGARIQDVTAQSGVFNPGEVQSVKEIWEECQKYGAEGSGYYFIVEKENDEVLGYACYGPRDDALAPGVFDLYWIAVDPKARRKGAGRRLLAASEEASRRMGGRILIIETSGSPHYEPTRKFYFSMGYALEATIKDFYAEGDDLAIFTKRL